MRRLLLLCIPVLTACASTSEHLSKRAPALTYDIVATYPHETSAFTEGLLLHHGVLFESTGLPGRSTLRRTDRAAQLSCSVGISRETFGEGIGVLSGYLYQLSQSAPTVHVYDIRDLAPVDTLSLPGGGWGMTSDGRRLIVSDGTARLRYFEERMRHMETLEVTEHGRPVERLNELEWVNGDIYANVWPSTRVVRINDQSGEVTGWLDLSAIAAQANTNDKDKDKDSVPNGIAYDQKRNTLLVTGKYWAKIYELRLHDP
ncbi:glutaminyl-peptide cyclotransferase [Luteibacter sp. Sphag1AF]|uniref:glutaminyl-peptide cyclotransferase n=1 Tax=Luteibacter sp. Sphag1AF TaxID=2587031 RepID=UPI001614F49C|nr:glutaminyl-peptide cyclotransferase [Luteibacter sp. Sphag1AF]MBB3227699.1 glutaminyl-peptide cyclotransferase [Luteibacter sp. Sphag1AF]